MWIEVNDRECTYDIVPTYITKSESKGTQIIMNASECKRLQMNADEWKWVQVSAIEWKWMQVNVCDHKWTQVNAHEHRWFQVIACERMWAHLNAIELGLNRKWTGPFGHRLASNKFSMDIDVSSRTSKYLILEAKGILVDTMTVLAIRYVRLEAWKGDTTQQMEVIAKKRYLMILKLKLLPASPSSR